MPYESTLTALKLPNGNCSTVASEYLFAYFVGGRMVRERIVGLLSSGRARRVLLAVRTALQSPSVALVFISIGLAGLLTLYALVVWQSGPLLSIVMGVLFGAVYFLMTIVFGILFYYKDNRELPLP